MRRREFLEIAYSLRAWDISLASDLLRAIS
jgi:hypothetical protein